MPSSNLDQVLVGDSAWGRRELVWEVVHVRVPQLQRVLEPLIEHRNARARSRASRA
jgi:hypothetical protein